MSKRRFKVERQFPVSWRKDELKLGEIFEVVAVDMWHVVGGGYYWTGSSQTDKPDFCGMRLRWLLKNKYLTELKA